MRVFIILFLGLQFFTTTIHAGCIRGNCKDGRGTLKLTNGDLYGGQFVNGVLSGKGWWKSKSGAMYKGDFKKGMVTGRGKLTLPSGDYYIGEFENGKFNGEGKYFFKQGDTYLGEWKDGKMDGFGAYTFASGKIRKGEFKAGKWLGKEESTSSEFIVVKEESTTNCNLNYCHDIEGVFTYSNGTRYIGEFRNGSPEGYGRCEFINGDLYEGYWKNHAPNGEGVMTFASGQKFAAIWDNGNPTKQLIKQEEFIASEKENTTTFNEDVDVYALVVGVANYDHMPSLKYTDDDAYQMYAFLRSPEGGAIPKENIKVLVDDIATRKNILSSMDNLFSHADENDVIMLYMSGHGLKGSFIPSDFDGYNNQISYKSIAQLLEKSKAKHKICIADACHSGSLVNRKDADYAPSINAYYQLMDALPSGGTALFLSSAANETSLEYSGLRQGVFSHFLIEGLSGKADFDGNKIITITELYQFVSNGVQEYTGKKQTPILTGNYNKAMPVAVIR